MSEAPRHPGVKFPPPFVFVLGALVGWLLGRASPLPMFETGRTAITSTAGWLGLVAGFTLVLWGLVTFRRAGTAIVPIAPATQIVQSGPYRFTRNPMYLGMTTMLIGGSVLTNSLWTLLTVPFVLILLHRFVIRREEAYLSAAFPAEYAAYRARVRRFI